MQQANRVTPRMTIRSPGCELTAPPPDITCPLCGRPGEALAVERLGSCWACHQRAEARRRAAGALWAASGLPPVARGRSFARLDRAKAHPLALAEAEGWEYGPAGLYLWGPTGTGKTYLAHCLANRQMAREGRAVLFLDLPRLFQALKASFSTGDRVPRELLQRASTEPLLILDDIGVGHGRDFGEAELLPIIDRRNGHRLPTVYTSNCAFSRARANPEFGTLADRLGTRVADRVAEAVRVVELTGPSRRAKGLA